MAKSQAKESSSAEDAAKLLTEDHRKVQKMFQEFKKLGDDDTEEKEELVRTACTELTIHAMIEEEIFYPALRGEIKDSSLLDEANVEHTVAKQLIGELEEMTPDEELYDAKFTVLGEYVNHHIAEEEKELFPQAKRAKVDMQAIGQQLDKRKQELLEKMAVDVDE
jgi:hemerythrin-like domain-containing protein